MLAEDIVSFVHKAGWTSRQAVIDTFREFEPERISYELRELVARKNLTTRNGDFCMEYALVGTASDAKPAATYKPSSPRNPSRVEALRTLASSGKLPDVVTREPPVLKKGDCREALLKGALDERPRSNIDLRSRVLARIDVSQTKMSAVLRDLIAEGRVEQVGSGSQTKFRLKQSTSQPAPASAPADQPTVSEAACTDAPAEVAQDNNGGTASIERPSLEAPDGAARDSSGGAEHPAADDAPLNTSAWEPEPREPLPAVSVTPGRPRSNTEYRFALWSDGSLQLLVEGEEIFLPADVARALCDYVSLIDYRLMPKASA